MARRRYTSYIQRPDSDDSDAEEHIFVGGKPSVDGGVRKRVGDIRFWLEDRENRRAQGERHQVNASASESDHNKDAQNSTLAKTTTTLKPKRRNTTTPRRILSHVEITAPAARKLHNPPTQFVTQQSSPPIDEPPLRPASPAMPPKKKKMAEAPSTARISKKGAGSSTAASALPPLAAPDLPTRRSRRTTVLVNYAEPEVEDPVAEVSHRGQRRSYVQSEDDYSELETRGSMSSTMSLGESTTSSVENTSDETESEHGTASKKARANNGRARKPAQSAAGTDTPVEGEEAVNVPGQKVKASRKSKSNMKNLASNQPKAVNKKAQPMSDIGDIFSDITNKSSKPIVRDPELNDDEPEIIDHITERTYKDVLDHLGGRRLRVATMCSGTESPLLALEMISEASKSLGLAELEYESVFSAEIVPFKQAYIERNFHPPIIFRDITEITHSKDGQATTAYGAKVDIPGNVDIVIAGTACVDFSNLNNNQKGLADRGESGDTFTAVLKYAEKYRPAMLVLENVFGAPWDDMLARYEAIGYLSAGVLVDTKNFYLPQTRQRGYMVCYDKERIHASEAENQPMEELMKRTFYERMQDFRRHASSPVSEFLLSNDDAIVIRSKQRMARQSALDSTLRDVDWAKCEIRHIKYRKTMNLGIARPLTEWQESGTLVLPENCDLDWFRKQVERVWDFIDMSFLRRAVTIHKKPTIKSKPRKNANKPKTKNAINPETKDSETSSPETKSVPGYDGQYKTRVWDVSQNIDRFTDTAPFGIAPCLTPSGNFYLPDRGGPLTHSECLILQGLPLGRISFTTETERNVQDLAGNAMSTTVVGSAILSALISGFEILDKPSHAQSGNENSVFETRITADEELGPFQSTSQAALHKIDMQKLLEAAAKSASMCVCEGQVGTTEKPIQTCSGCGHTSCIACGIKPSHEYHTLPNSDREHPEHFIREWRSQIPMLVQFVGIQHVLRIVEEALKVPGGNTKKYDKERSLKKQYANAVADAVQTPLTFSGFRRASSWILTYESNFARLELVLNSKHPKWKLYAKPSNALQGDNEVRTFLEEPIATTQALGDSFLGAKWQWRVFELATNSIRQLTIEGVSEEGEEGKVPSWAARLGLPKHLHEQVWTELDVTVLSPPLPDGVDIEGRYRLLQNCGTACESLYKRTQPPSNTKMFLFLDPARIGNPKDDGFVFASDPSKMQYDQVREVVARLDAKWRPENLTKLNASPQVAVYLNGGSAEENSCSLAALDVSSSICLNENSLLNSECKSTKAVATLQFDLPSSVDDKSLARFQGLQSIAPDNKAFFQTFGWAMEPLRQNHCFSGAHDLHGDVECTDCAPTLPEVRWRIFMNGTKAPELRAYEDPETARRYEKAIKERPEPFLIESDLRGKSVTLKVGINILTLCERAVGKLSRLTDIPGSVSWNLDTNWLDEAAENLPAFILRNNRNEDESADGMLQNNTELFPIQKKSLTWMKNQERDSGQVFDLKETEEALLPYLGWRLEAQASARVHVKGGILADHAGFGKTVTSLALIQSEFSEKSSADHIKAGMRNLSIDIEEDGKQVKLHKLAATLVICPPNLVHQWEGEIELLLGREYSSDRLVMINKADELIKKTVEEFEAARIILVSNKVLSSKRYRDHLAMFAAIPEYNGNKSRALQSWLKDAASRAQKHLQMRKEVDSELFKQQLKKRYEDILNDQKYREFAEQSKRVKGKQYLAQQEKVSGKLKYAEIELLKNEQLDTTNAPECALLHMFHFNRLIVDEFSYSEGDDLVAYCSLTADKRWALSATPRMKDTYDVSRMARFLDLNLPIGASAPGLLSNANMTALRKDMTNLEQFETFRELPSRTSQEKIHTLAQDFLNTFVRQNVLAFDDKPYRDIIVPVVLHADHRLVYTDLSQKLNSQDMRIRKGDFKGRLRVMPGLSTAEEALVSTAAIFDPKKRLLTVDENTKATKAPKPSRRKANELDDDQSSDAGEQTTCDLTVESVINDVGLGLEALSKQRETDHKEARDVLKASLKKCSKRAQDAKLKDFEEWLQNIVSTKSLGDWSVTKEVVKMSGLSLSKLGIESAETCASDEASLSAPEDDNTTGAQKSAKRKRSEIEVASKDTEGEVDEGDGITADAEDAKESGKLKTLKDAMSIAIRDVRSYLNAERTLRFVKHAEQHVHSRHDPSKRLTCNVENCKGAVTDADDLDVSAACGHVLCADCIDDSRKQLGICPVSVCGKEVHSFNLLRLGKLGDSVKSAYGNKVEKVIQLLKTVVPEDDQVILFVQFEDQIKELTNALESESITYYKTNQDTGMTLRQFQAHNDNEAEHVNRKKVLILNSDSESAAGANLTGANHVIFFSPLIKTTQYEYEAQMAQAIGRVRRHKQNKPIFVYRIVALDTIDVDILEHRERNTKVLEEMQESDTSQMQVDGTDFEGAYKKSGQAKPCVPDKMQLIRDVDGKIKLVPRKMLLAFGKGNKAIFETEKRIMGYEKFNNLLKFSRAFTQDD
ncbi:hypothetical protein D6C77_01186 [Aureobasidium pullulans]|nr:hypothetical protein D6C77_01186 [Aureobasidium pullulans]